MKFTCTVRGKILLNAYTGWIKPEDKVLDIGCGNGNIGKLVKENFGCELEGTDIMNFVAKDIPFKLMPNETTLPYSDGTFDIAMLNDILHHTTKQKEVIDEALRVAKSVLIFETEPTLMAKVLDHVLNWGHNIKMPIPLTHRNSKDWASVFENMNLKVEYKKPKSSLFYPVSHFAFKIRRG